ncbi:hypothetical protein [Pseudomonas sp. CMR5c]|uniref:hypothetical protein n=1 Tax=Pseudomonas sp. CMR5c TaxID=658630 RepID=UPI00069ED68C|nr:hypothetical protein [Pseudomonas sp. CMR5c]
MTEKAIEGAGHVILHKPASTFVRDVVEHVNVGSMTSSDGTIKISIFFSRDELEVTHETLVASKDDPEKLVPTIGQDAISAFRLDIANLSMSIKTAKALLRNLDKTLKGFDTSPSDE